MTFDVCCLILTLLSAHVSDSVQTARFTHKYETSITVQHGRYVTRTEQYLEDNPFAAPFVDNDNPRGEIALTVMAFLSASRLQRWNNWQSQAVILVWTGLHTAAVLKNQEKHPEVPVLIMFPVLTAQW